MALFSLTIAGSVTTARAGVISYPGYPGDPPRHPLRPAAKYLVLIVLDGARPDYLTLTRLPHLAALEAHGTEYTRAFAGILESETPAGHATISTGSSPQRSGILGFSWAENDGNFSLFSPQVVRSGAMERIMANAHAPTIAGLFKARFPGTQVVALSGHKYYAADPLGGPNADAIMYFRGTLQKTYAPTAIPGHVPPQSVFNDPTLTAQLNKLKFGQDDSMVTQLTLDTFAVMHQRVTLINYPDFDWPLGHVDGGITDPKLVIQLMQGFDTELGRIEDAYARAGILNQTIFVVTADHGMSPIRRYIPGSIVNNAIKQAGTTAPSIARNTATYVWLRAAGKAARVAEIIVRAHDPGIESVYYEVTTHTGVQYRQANGLTIPAELDAANRFLLNTLVNGHEPQVVVFSRHNQTTSNPSSHWKADHGGNGWGAQHVPLIIAGPGIRSGLVSNQPAQLEDIAPTVLTDLGVQPVGMQGHVLTDALIDPSQADIARRTRELKRITPLVQAMVEDSQLPTQTDSP